jgi:peptidoglycan hydrolase CwlO-like protein
MKKLTEEMRKEDIPRVKTLQKELDNLNTLYKNLKEDFDLINLSNKELKNIFYDKTVKKDSLDNDYSRSKEIGDLKEDNKELQKKMDIMVDKLKKLTEEGKENEADIDRLKLEIKKYKESGSGKSAFSGNLVAIPCEHVEITGNKSNVCFICN